MEKIQQVFKKCFGYFPPAELRAACAPARVNLIGEHIDYHGGAVMPAAISRYTWVLAVPSAEPRVRVFSALFNAKTEWDIRDRKNLGPSSWVNYMKGVFVGLSRRRLVKSGFDAVILSDIPIGAGLSSSASLEVACAYAFLGASGRKNILNSKTTQPSAKFQPTVCLILKK